MSTTTQTIATVLSVSVALAALVGLFVAIQNIRKADMNCNVRTLSWGYIVFFVIAVLAMFGAGSAIFKGTELAAGAGLTLAAFSSLMLFVIGVLMLFTAPKMANDSLRKMNIAVWSILVGLSLANTVYLLVQRQGLLTSQPVLRALNYARNQIGRAAGSGGSYAPVPTTGGGAGAGTGGGGSLYAMTPVRA